VEALRFFALALTLITLANIFRAIRLFDLYFIIG